MKTKCNPQSPACPTIFKTEQGTYVIIGKRVDPEQYDKIKDRVAADEATVEISAELVEACVEEFK